MEGLLFMSYSLFSLPFHVMESRNDPIHEGKFPVGTKVQAVFSDDGERYDATIEAHTVNGYFVAMMSGGNKEEVDPDNVRPIENNALLEAERSAQATKKLIVGHLCWKTCDW